MDKVSYNEFSSPITIRAIVGSSKPLDPGPQHKQNYTNIFKELFNFPVLEVDDGKCIELYSKKRRRPVMFIEHREYYDKRI